MATEGSALEGRKAGMSARLLRQWAPKGRMVEVSYTTINPPNGTGSIIGRSGGIVENDTFLTLEVKWHTEGLNGEKGLEGIHQARIPRQTILCAIPQMDSSES